MAADTGPNPAWIDELESPVAFVFGGGASLGASQIGMARSLVEAGVTPDMVVGTSVGALNGSFLARQFDLDQIDKLETIWRNLTRDDVFPGLGWFRLAQMLTSEDFHLADATGLRALVDDHLPETHADLAVPTTVLASNVLSGNRVILREGDLRSHVLASASIPFVFKPVRRDGELWIDGGVTSNVPVLPARQLGANSIVVLDPGYPCSLEEPPSGLMAFSLHLVTIMLRHQAHPALHLLADDLPILYIPPPCPVEIAPHEFERSGELIDAGYRQAESLLADVDFDGPGIYGHPHFHGNDPLRHEA